MVDGWERHLTEKVARKSWQALLGVSSAIRRLVVVDGCGATRYSEGSILINAAAFRDMPFPNSRSVADFPLPIRQLRDMEGRLIAKWLSQTVERRRDEYSVFWNRSPSTSAQRSSNNRPKLSQFVATCLRNGQRR
jgi:hypothetical protein